MLMAQPEGPFEHYLKATGKSPGDFHADLRRGDAAAASILAAEILYKAVQDLIRAVANARPG